MTDPQTASAAGNRVVLGATFVNAARRYWLTVFPEVRRELAGWRERAAEIPDPVLRRLAREAQRKHGNVEGAAAFATYVPRARRGAVVRALVALQAIYDYLDVLAEQPRAHPVAGARGLHAALLVALDPTAPAPWRAADTAPSGGKAPAPAGGQSPPTPGLDPSAPPRPHGRQPDYYAQYPQGADGGYLAELVDACRTALATLPSYPAVAAAARRSAARIVEFQSLNLSESQGDHDALARWARAETPPGTDLRWWEAAAAGGSPLCLYALLAAAAAADPAVTPCEAEAIEHAYFPSIGALHSLLDHLVDRPRDAAAAQRNLLDYYASPREAGIRMRALALRAMQSARSLPRGNCHAIVLVGMAGHYLSSAGASSPGALPIAGEIRATLGALVTPTLLVFRAQRIAGRGADAWSGQLTAASSADPQTERSRDRTTPARRHARSRSPRAAHRGSGRHERPRPRTDFP